MKRLFDLILAATALVLLLPVALVVALLVALFLGRPVLFRQTRPGLHARPIEIFKFRSMTDARAPSGELRSDGERLTRFGRTLRALSLDEIPQLISVLRGDMSIVGPRPLLMHYLPLYSPEQARRHDVKPGITGWAQVNGRNALDWPDKFALDIWYVDNHSLWLDLRICWMTLQLIAKRTGISNGEAATMPQFTGSTPRDPATRSDGDGSAPARARNWAA